MEGHLTLTVTEENKAVTVYAIVMHGSYGFENGHFIKVSATGPIPTILEFSHDRSGFHLKDYREPMDGAGYITSIHELFPEHLWEACASFSEETIQALEKQERSYARQYLKRIGRDAPIGYKSYEIASIYPYYTDAGLSIEVSNHLYEVKKIKDYPDWIGDRERIEDGVRYKYETALNKAHGEIIFTKSEYDTGKIVETIRFNIYSGKEIS